MVIGAKRETYAVSAAATLAAAFAAACAAPDLPPVRYQNALPVRIVNDRSDTPEVPEPNVFAHKLYHLDNFALRRTTRLMEIPESRRAMNINALDEVPDSTWFTNRIGVTDLTTEDVAQGPGRRGGPDASGPWMVTGTKVGGKSVGMIFKDAAGEGFLLKFDEQGVSEAETAADVVVQRLLWAIGYNVPDDQIVIVPRERLELAPNATIKDVFGTKSQMTEADLEDKLSEVNRNADGTYRALASRFLRGAPLGGWPQEGQRQDDPNDVVPHEHRREVRAMRFFFAWVNHTDVKEDNTLDMWVEDPDDPNTHYVRHYLVDFGKALGVFGHVMAMANDGYAHTLDFDIMARSLITVGLWTRPWEGADGPEIAGIARFEAEHFDIDDWRPRYPYIPFNYADRFDAYWATKIIMRFSPELIREAVRAGRYSDPRAEQYMFETLLARQRQIGRTWLTRMNPIDDFSIADGRLCFKDLLRFYGLQYAETPTTYSATAFDPDGQSTGWTAESAATETSQVCFAGVQSSRAADGYTMIAIETHRSDERDDDGIEPVIVHLARSPEDDKLRIIGLWRQ